MDSSRTKAKKVGILTQPLLNNYGGLLQAYALMFTIKKLGFDVWIINREYKRRNKFDKLKSLIKSLTLKYLQKKKNILLQDPKEEEKREISKHTSYFKEKYINTITPALDSSEKMGSLNSMGFYAYIVGSDQVWRPKYSPSITNFFLDFVDSSKKVKKIAYAASFGVSNWEFNQKDTFNCSRLAKDFDAISVRESSGLLLCEKYLGVDAIQVLDPTMLLDADDYINLVQNEKEPDVEGTLMVYVLDKSEDKRKFIEGVAQKLNLRSFSVMQKEQLTFQNRNNIVNSVFPPVTRWLKGIRDAEFIITDSFHGCAFSILFNKPFLAIGNRERGITRFESLLTLFNLNDRLITNIKSYDENILQKEIKWDEVNDILLKERLTSLQFLKNSL